MQNVREKEYARTITALNRTGNLTLLPRSESSGVIGIDGREYPVPAMLCGCLVRIYQIWVLALLSSCRLATGLAFVGGWT